MERKHSVLVIDDDTTVLSSLNMLFLKEPYRVFLATGGKQALEILEKEQIDLVLSDQRMPEMTGVDFFKLIRDKYPFIIRMIITGQMDIMDAVAAINEGMVYKYITKPWDPDDLKITIKNALEKYDLTIRNEELNKELEEKNTALEEKVGMLEKRVAELKAVREIGVAAQMLDLKRLLNLIIESCINALNAQTVFLMLFDKTTEELIVHIAEGENKDEIKGKVVNIGEKIVGWVMKERTPILIKNIEEESQFNRKDCLINGANSLICVPLVSKRYNIGVIKVDNKKDNSCFNEDELRFLTIIAAQTVSAIDNAQLYENVHEAYFETICVLAAAIEDKNEYFKGHSGRVSRYCVKIAEKMELSKEQIKILQYAGILHDIGQIIGVSDKIISKQGRLLDTEIEEVKKHPLLGEKIVEAIDFLQKTKRIIVEHHEQIDGKGYPNGLLGENISLDARILLVAEAYDAMISDRPYRKALSKSEAIEELQKSAGTVFDKEIVKVFVELLRE